MSALAVACMSDGLQPRSPFENAPPSSPIAVVSNPDRVTGGTMSVTADSGVVYVSLQPGTVPDGGIATVVNTRTGASVPAPMVDGGFDPVGIGARSGDTLTISVEVTGGGTHVPLTVVVPPSIPPVIVRTDPPPRRRDVPLNGYFEVVFSEPVSTSSVSGIQLTGAGKPVSGHVTLSADGLRAQFQPDALLVPSTEYTLVIPSSVADLSGDHLAQPLTVSFTTGTTVIQASVVTQEAALILNPFSQQLHTFNLNAVLANTGSFSGSFSIFYPTTGARVFGAVRCFAIRADTAWVAGDVEGASDTSGIGREFGWQVIDRSSSGNGADGLSLAVPLADYGFGTSQAFCANTPPFTGNGDLVVVPLLSGDIVVNSSGPPPPPPFDTLSRIAFAAWPNGGIQVIRADSSGWRVLTSDSGDFSPAWSPDGSNLAFDRYDRAKMGRDIYVMNAHGTGLRRMTSDSGFDNSDPSWSPDGSRIAFGRNGAIYLMKAADSSSLLPLTGYSCNYHPTWSPDGGRIAFASCRTGRNAIFVMNADGSGLRQLTSSPVGDYSPWWSPDGTRIVFERGTCCANSVYIINADGTGLRQLAILGRTPSWSPDSRAVVFEWFGMHVVNADGTGIVPLGPGYDPAWSPSGAVPSRPQPAASLLISPAVTITLSVGDTVQFVATPRDVRGEALPDRVVAWFTSDSAQSTVATDPPRYSQTWQVSAVAPGAATVFALIDGLRDSVVVVVH